MIQPEFDRYSASYEELLRDPVRDRFAGGDSEFFHARKRDLIREYFRKRGVNTHELRYLDIGCGKGELLSMLRCDFGYVAGCDPSSSMLSFVTGNTVVQSDPAVLPFADASFHFISAVCVYHHLSDELRLAITREVYRVLCPGGFFAMVEHNPKNPVTRRIVSRTPVDADAILLSATEARQWMSQAGFSVNVTRYFLFFPELLYKHGGSALERLLARVPMGGQYAVFATKGLGV